MAFEMLLAFLAGALLVAAIWTAWVLRPGRKLPPTGPQQAATLVGKTDFDLSPPSVAERYRSEDRRVMQSGLVSRREESVARPGGEVGWAQTVKVPLFDPQGRVVGTAGVARTRSASMQAKA